MWRFTNGTRPLSEPEWGLLRAGLDLILWSIETDISRGSNDTDMDVSVFDNLSPGQRLLLLVQLAATLRAPGATPRPTAAQEAALAAVLVAARAKFCGEVVQDACGAVRPRHDLRRHLLGATAASASGTERLSCVSVDAFRWDELFEEFAQRFVPERDNDVGEEELARLPADDAWERLVGSGLADDDYHDVPPEPDARGLADAQRELAELIGRRTTVVGDASCPLFASPLLN